MNANEGPLDGLKVIDFSTYQAGPRAAKLCADWGADVIAVGNTSEIPGGDFGKMYGVPTTDSENPLMQNNSANKRSIRVNMKTAEGMAIMEHLLEKTDIIITNFREDALKRLNMDYETLSAKYPHLIYGSVTGYGDKGPDSERPGFDSTAYWARGGLMASIGEPDAPPPVPLGGFGDNPTAVFLVCGILAAVYGRINTGKGQKVTGALYNTAIFNMNLELACANYYPNMVKKSVMNPVSPLINVYKCADEKWISLTSLNYNKDWKLLCETFERPDLVDDPRCNTARAIGKNSAEIAQLFSEIIKKEKRDEWVSRWSEADIPHELVLDMKEILTDEQAHVNSFLQPCTFESGNTIYMAGTPVQLSDYEPNCFERLMKQPGEHTKEVMKEIGYSDNEIINMKTNGIIG